MIRSLTAAVVATAGLLGAANKADAQYVYGYNTYVPNAGAFVGGTTYATPFGAKTVTNYYSPFTGTGVRQAYYADVFGDRAFRTAAYNPAFNLGYRGGYSYFPAASYFPAGIYGVNNQPRFAVQVPRRR